VPRSLGSVAYSAMPTTNTRLPVANRMPANRKTVGTGCGVAKFAVPIVAATSEVT